MDDALQAAVATLPHLRPGEVSLTGAVLGDPRLLTAQAQALAFEAPAIIAIGAIVAVRAKLQALAVRIPEMVA
jgi:siroheme synthase